MSDPHPDEDGRNRAYQVGISVGLEQASGFLMERAVQGFKTLNPFADELRRLALDIKKESDAAHPGVRKS